VNVFFYDRRDNPGTNITNGSEGTPNYRDYINSVSVDTRACVAYADGRDGDPDAYFACVDL
jgi:hypothetical protein